MNPLPTPYDIKGIPTFPYQPGETLWMFLALILIAILLLALYTRFFSRHTLVPLNLVESIQDLQSHRSPGSQRYVLKRIQDLSCVLLSRRLATSLDSLSHTELTTFRHHPKLTPELSRLLDELIWIREHRFSGIPVSPQRVSHALEALSAASQFQDEEEES